MREKKKKLLKKKTKTIKYLSKLVNDLTSSKNNRKGYKIKTKKTKGEETFLNLWQLWIKQNAPQSKQTKYAKTLRRHLSFRSDKHTFIPFFAKRIMYK